MHAVDELGEAPDQVDRGGLDAADREQPTDRGLARAQGDSGEYPVDPAPPGAVLQTAEVPRRPGRAVEAPPHVRGRGPHADPLEVVVGERELNPDRGQSGEVEHRGRADPAVGKVEQPGGQGEHRVGLHRRAVGDGDPNPATGVRVGVERGRDQRGVALDVGAHHDDLARLDAPGEQVQQDLPQHLHLTGRAVAGVDLHGAVPRRNRGGVGRRGAGAQVVLQPSEQRGPASLGVVDGRDQVGHRREQATLEMDDVLREGGEQRVLRWVGVPHRRAGVMHE